MQRLITILLLASLGWFGYAKYEQGRTSNFDAEAEVTEPAFIASVIKEASASSSFRCDGRTHCSQMTSCSEATYFLKNCPGVKMDGNNDGVPCEQQWCK